MLARWPLLHILAMAAVATLFAAVFWKGMTEHVTPLIAGLFALAPAALFWRARNQPESERGKLYLMAWALLVGMLIVFTFLSPTAL